MVQLLTRGIRVSVKVETGVCVADETGKPF